eukprot:TRINITY_DN1788_c0_g1_i1.p1 TRINITY_DN1788_c0_g1~~TRINITY_DN1788_c0_g1_i1.p1  ORF type:complete len:153 (+),score=43.87 TRINITY_DN1788_c0_g1_i1:25-459(+)
MSDEALDTAMGGERKYTLKHYLALAHVLQEKAKEIGEKENGLPFTPHDVECAIWTSSAADNWRTNAETVPAAGAAESNSCFGGTAMDETAKKADTLGAAAAAAAGGGGGSSVSSQLGAAKPKLTRKSKRDTPDRHANQAKRNRK